ncbi:DUF7144 family membrane protein [Streptomyces griseocarneus]|uniref:DUF7144 family membrane protein n=1 Tax=Streptomyces griseocarneus TaxID=51201 RepID=UPI00167D5221|nr:hypothetical protein [Streptomyces griseocarneus]MBZ6477122.1 hypothetical protein [Streptomyces griseocarneus]GHG53667.1 hypothetical protein GCM10018779_15810 [Streptomyces griseocarneus]
MSSSLNPSPGGSQAAAGGLTVFAAVMMLVLGFLDLFRGVMALVHDDIFVTTPHYVFRFNLTGWGWIHLLLGILAIMVGVGLFKVSLWARVVGVAMAVLLLVANFLSIPYYPLWSIVVIALSAFVIWALCVVKPDSGPDGGTTLGPIGH